MKLSNEEVLKIAKLSRLELSDEQVEKFGNQLSSVLNYVEKLNQVETSNVEETSQVTGLINVYRPDEKKDFDDMEGLVNQAPQHEDNQVRVHNVL